MPIQESPPVGGLSFLVFWGNMRFYISAHKRGSVTFLFPNKKVTKEIGLRRR